MRAICFFVCLLVHRCFAGRFSYIHVRPAWSQNLTKAVDPSLVGNPSCQICYGDAQCWNADSIAARCEYLAETSKLTTPDPEDDAEEDQGEGTGVRVEVDEAFGALMGKAANDERFQDCIPHVSQYTNCHRGNICLGCKRCSCSSTGTWSCQQIQKCRSKRIQLEIEEETLNLAIEKLNSGYSNSRRKRSYRSNFEKPTDYVKKPTRLYIRSLDLTSTIQPPENSGGKTAKKVNDSEQRITKQLKPYTKQRVSYLEKEHGLQLMTEDLFKEIKRNLSISGDVRVSKNKSDVELTFEDLLNIDANHTHSVTYHPHIENKTSTNIEELKRNYDIGDLLKIVNVIYNVKGIISNGDTTEQVHSTIKTTTEISPTYEAVTFEQDVQEKNSTDIPIKSDIRSSPELAEETDSNVARRNESHNTFMDFNLIDDINMNINRKVSKKYMDDNLLSDRGLTDYSDFEELNTVNVSKRDVHDTDQLDNIFNTPQPLQSLNEDVLQPLNNIINEKQLEINDLKKVKEKLLHYLKTYSDKNLTLNSNKTQLVEESKQFAIYQLAISPQNMDDNSEVPSRRSELNKSIQSKDDKTVSKYLRKLRRDIYEILKDVIAIKKITRKEEPHDLKLLIRALKFYIRSQTKEVKQFSRDDEPLSWWDSQKKTRRDNTEIQETSYVQDELRHIFLILDKDISEGKALRDLSQYTRKFIKRVIYDLVTENSVQYDNNDLHYNLTDKFATFGERINRSLADIRNASVFDFVDKMKMLHCVLNADAEYLQNALLALNKHVNRRNQEEIDKEFEAALEIIKKEVDLTKKLMTRMFIDASTSNDIKSRPKPKIRRGRKRDSFMRYLKKILGKSKKGVLDMIHRATPLKKDTNFELMTLNRLMEYEKVMKKWQKDLDVSPKREKRSVRRKVSDAASELKNILPKYLRGKVGPGIIAKTKANRVNQRRYYVERDSIFNNNDNNVQGGEIYARSAEVSKTYNFNVKQVMENNNVNNPNFLLTAPRKTGVRTKKVHTDSYSSSNIVP